MRLFGKKKLQVQESSYEIFGGAIIKKVDDVYEISWKGSHPMTVQVSSQPIIDSNVKTKQEGEIIRITSPQCKLKITTENEKSEAFISEL